MSCQLILLVVLYLKLSDEDMSMSNALLEPLLAVRAVWEGTMTYQGEVYKTLVTKLQRPE